MKIDSSWCSQGNALNKWNNNEVKVHGQTETETEAKWLLRCSKYAGYSHGSNSSK